MKLENMKSTCIIELDVRREHLSSANAKYWGKMSGLKEYREDPVVLKCL